jgi:hypothetical protein
VRLVVLVLQRGAAWRLRLRLRLRLRRDRHRCRAARRVLASQHQRWRRQTRLSQALLWVSYRLRVMREVRSVLPSPDQMGRWSPQQLLGQLRRRTLDRGARQLCPRLPLVDTVPRAEPASAAPLVGDLSRKRRLSAPSLSRCYPKDHRGTTAQKSLTPHRRAVGDRCRRASLAARGRRWLLPGCQNLHLSKMQAAASDVTCRHPPSRRRVLHSPCESGRRRTWTQLAQCP